MKNQLNPTDNILDLSTIETVQFNLQTAAIAQLDNLLYANKKDDKVAYKAAKQITLDAKKTILTHNAVNQLNVIAAKAGWMDVVILLRHTKATVDTIAELNSEK